MSALVPLQPSDIARRRLELFPPEPSLPAAPADRFQGHVGTSTNHCGICPKEPDELCSLACVAERAALEAKEPDIKTIINPED